MDERIAAAIDLVSRGERVYRACEQAGINLRAWYRYKSGAESLSKRNKLRRLKKRQTLLRLELAEIDRSITALGSK